MILHADIDAFFVSVEVLLRPELKGRPVVVGGLPNERGVVATCSYEARRYGIRSGIALSVAYRLCPHAVFLRGNFANYHDYSDQFFRILANYTPVMEVVSLDEAYLDITGTRRLFGLPVVLARRIKAEVREKTGLPISIGIGRSKTVAKIATDLAKPDGIKLILPDQELEILGPLDISAIPGVGPKATERLNLIGIKTIADLIDAPEWMVREAMGKVGIAARKLVTGGDLGRRPPSTHSISRETTLAEDSNDHRFLEALLFYLADRSAAAARRERVKGTAVTVRVRFSDFRTISRGRKIEATNLSQKIFPIVKEIFWSMVTGVRKRIRLVGMNLGKLQPATDQALLFDKGKTKQLDQAVDLVRNRYGFSSVIWAKERLIDCYYKKRQNGYWLHTPKNPK